MVLCPHSSLSSPAHPPSQSQLPAMDPPPLLTLILSFILTISSSWASAASTLDPKQLTALQSMGLPTTHDPCSSSSRNKPNNLTACDSSAPFRHLTALTLADCSADLDVSSTALRSLSTLRSLSFLRCPLLPQFKHPLPSPLASNLRSFTCVSSFKRISGVWLSHLKNLTDLNIVSVPVSASAPFVFLSQMPHLSSATVSDCNLTGKIPHHWHSLNLTRLDLSLNKLTGAVPASINVLGSLESLNLSSNSLAGALPDSIGDLIYLKNVSFSQNSLSGPVPDSVGEMPELTHLDLGSNQFNGSVPRFLGEMKKLKYLNLENNNFQGVMPFNASFIKKLEVFKIGGNTNLCYNHSLISSKLKLGIAPCDKYGLPASPPADKATKSDSSSDNGNEEDDDGDGDVGSGKSSGGQHGPNKLVLGVAIGLSCLVFLVIFLVCISKCCS